MRKRKITCKLFSPDSIEKAIEELEKSDCLKQVDVFCQKLAEKGVKIAQKRIVTLGATFTNELLNSIRFERKESGVFVIKTDCEHAAFVEFGTGQVGESAPYPYQFPEGVEWQYNVGKTIFEISDGQYGWFYPADDGTWKFTQGMPARPFMYETALELREEVNKVAKEVFRSDKR